MTSPAMRMIRTATREDDALKINKQVTQQSADVQANGLVELMEKLKIEESNIVIETESKKSRVRATSNALVTSAEKLTLQTLQKDMVLAIFDFLDPTPSTCLGMTCKAFYPIHRERHGAVHLTTKGLYDPIKKCLWQLLRSFFPGLVFCFEIKKFVTLERCEEIPHVSSFGLERLQESIFRMVEDLPSRSS